MTFTDPPRDRRLAEALWQVAPSSSPARADLSELARRIVDGAAPILEARVRPPTRWWHYAARAARTNFDRRTTMNESAQITRVAARPFAISVLVVVAIASGMAGAAADRLALRVIRPPTLTDTGFHPISSLLRSPTAQDRQQIREELSEALDLSTVQDSLIDNIMAQRAGEFDAIRLEMRPRVERLVTDVRADIEKVLTDDQREAFRRLQQADHEQVSSANSSP